MTLPILIGTNHSTEHPASGNLAKRCLKKMQIRLKRVFLFGKKLELEFEVDEFFCFDLSQKPIFNFRWIHFFEDSETYFMSEKDWNI